MAVERKKKPAPAAKSPSCFWARLPKNASENESGCVCGGAGEVDCDGGLGDAGSAIVNGFCR